MQLQHVGNDSFNSDETTSGRFTAADLWKQYNGANAPAGQGLLEILAGQGFDVWLVRATLAGDDINSQALNFARAIQQASTWASYNRNVAVGGYSMGGLVARIALAKWGFWHLSAAPPVNLIVALDSPLRGALLSNDAQHAFWNASLDNGSTAHDKNMDSCAAQQMLENACHKTLNCSDCLECNDRGWQETFFGGNSFTFCNPSQGICSFQTAPPFFPTSGMKTCSGVGLANTGNGGWWPGIRRIGASLGHFSESTGVCYGDNTGLDRTGSGVDGCPLADGARFGTGTEWGYIDISLSTDRTFHYQSLANVSADSGRVHSIDELTPGSRQPASVESVSETKFGFKIANGHQFLHMGTFIPLYSALDLDPATGLSSLDEYWTNSYNAFHDALPTAGGSWYNQRTGAGGSDTLVSWLIGNLNNAFAAPAASGCGEASCAPAQAMYVSHFSGPGCTGVESYYLHYDGYAYSCRTWDGNGTCGTAQHTVTNYSARILGGGCQDLWPGGNTLSQMVTVYRPPAASSCPEWACTPSQGMYVSHFSAPGCGGNEFYYLPYDGYAYGCRSWDGGGHCGTVEQTVTAYSARINGGECQDLWPGGNTLAEFVAVYR